MRTGGASNKLQLDTIDQLIMSVFPSTRSNARPTEVRSTIANELPLGRSLLLLFFAASLLISPFVHAADVSQQITDQINAGASSAGYGEAKDPRQVAAEIIQIGLGLVGTLFIVLIVMSGYWYITARGDESKVEKAEKTVRGAVIGIIVVLLAWSITIFVSSKSQEAVREPPRNRAQQLLGR